MMGKLSFGWMLDCLCLSPGPNSCCICISSLDSGDFSDRRSLIPSNGGELVRLRDFVDGNQSLAFHLKPKTVVLRVSMHCNGCAKKVEKHISKMEGVTSCQVDLESKKVVVIGDILPFEVLESVSKAFWVVVPHLLKLMIYIKVGKHGCRTIINKSSSPYFIPGSIWGRGSAGGMCVLFAVNGLVHQTIELLCHAQLCQDCAMTLYMVTPGRGENQRL